MTGGPPLGILVCPLGSSTNGFDRTAQGTFRTSKIGNAAGNDYSVIDVNSNWTPKPVVHTAQEFGTLR